MTDEVAIPVHLLRRVQRAWFEPGQHDLTPTAAVEALMKYLPPDPEGELVETMCEAAWEESDDYQRNGAPWGGVAEYVKDAYRTEMREAFAAIRLHHAVIPIELLEKLRTVWWGEPGTSVEVGNQAMRDVERLLDGGTTEGAQP